MLAVDDGVPVVAVAVTNGFGVFATPTAAAAVAVLGALPAADVAVGATGAAVGVPAEMAATADAGRDGRSMGVLCSRNGTPVDRLMGAEAVVKGNTLLSSCWLSVMDGGDTGATTAEVGALPARAGVEEATVTAAAAGVAAEVAGREVVLAI